MRCCPDVPAGCVYVPGRDELTSQQESLAESLAYEFGEAYDSYLLLDDHRSFFFASDGSGVLSFSLWRRHAFVVGGLLTSPELKPRLLRQFLDFAKRNRMTPRFINILESDVALYREHGFQISKIGEEPIVDLRSLDWRGKRYEWIRRQVNLCVRDGVSYTEIDLSAVDVEERASLIAHLNRISKEHVESTVYGRELTLMVGKIDFERLGRKRLFVAWHDKRPVAFVVANPVYGGQMWAVEAYRKASDAPRGAIPYLIVQVAQHLQEEGVPFLSLCQVPALRCRNCPDSEDPLVRRTMWLWWDYAPWFYDPTRQYHFKSRFRPAYRENFVATPPCRNLIPMTVFGWKWGVVMPDLRRVPLHMLQRIRKWSHTESLADPYAEEFERLGDLRPLIDPGEEAASPIVNVDEPIPANRPRARRVRA